eukprot:1194909-Prorocentrum_minimum.AAC.10
MLSLQSGKEKMPGKFKRKAMYMLKINAVAISNDNLDSEIMIGDFSDLPLENLNVISQEVFLPLMCNPANQEGWPEVISKEVTDNFHKFIANIYVTIGQTKGKTLLPLPPSDEGDGSKDKERIHVLESAVVTWTRQIKNVLKTDPEAALRDGKHPGPLVEVRATNRTTMPENVPCG